MHIHGNFMNIQSASLYAAASSERAAAAQRTAETRRRLLKAAQSVASEADPDATALAGHWLNLPHNQALAEDEYTPGPPVDSARL